eukprot:CAMPEP_0183355646 /NCGR_PEP_ID=MMETSP0164_2-20130417/41261_1 /TAXON_ID=221442 /ORGANISM="Coccolithus pelagicus ssp braarudi, Strain PLY182g" /LENGTH=150 /DNA_ID=CAMNT_0025528811 /DNA_START=8 /DNA_END=457 /DNA_ORIENTATION=+
MADQRKVLALFGASGGVILLVLGAYLHSQAKPFGKLNRWYEVPTCRDWTITSTEFSVFPLSRAALSGEDGGGSSAPCTLSGSTNGAPARILLEQGDGFKPGVAYTAVAMVGSRQYAVLGMSVENVNGAIVSPTVNLELGPDYNYPWRAVD